MPARRCVSKFRALTRDLGAGNGHEQLPVREAAAGVAADEAQLARAVGISIGHALGGDHADVRGGVVAQSAP